jgi:tetratricopeptide (TPR) repeat protein
LSRDNVLFVLIGVLVGFIAGYLLHEVMAARQPPRLIHGEAGPAAPGAAGGPGAAADPAQGQAAALLQEARSLEGYLASNPDDAEAVMRLASLSSAIESWDRCVEMYERYLEMRPESAGVLSDLGICYRSLGRFDRALELFDRAQELEPGHFESRFNEAVVLGLDQREFEAAERLLEELRGLRPNDPNVEILAEAIARLRRAA